MDQSVVVCLHGMPYYIDLIKGVVKDLFGRVPSIYDIRLPGR